MGMRVGGSGSMGASQSASMANWQQRQQSVNTLTAALQSGDLGAAQKAFSGLSGGNSSVKGNSPLAQIGQALQSGDLAGAQQAAQALQAARNGHHQGATQPTQPASSNSATLGSVINTTV